MQIGISWGAKIPSFFSGLTALWIFSAAVSALSAPDAKSGKVYQWLFRFSHLLAANLDRAGLLPEEACVAEETLQNK